MFDYPSELNLHGNHILNEGGWSVDATGGLFPTKTQDFSGNYWGPPTRTRSRPG